MTKAELTGKEISMLTAELTGGGFKRSANREAAVARFRSAAAEAGISNPDNILAMNFEDAQASLKPKPVATGGEDGAIEQALREFIGGDERSHVFMRDLFRRVFQAGAASKPARKPRERTGPTKREIAAGLLMRPEGATSKEILEATGWPAVSVPAIARASKLSLRTEKDGRASRYFGTSS
ncbi:DUF3489 domain-containing protein [Pararhizobium haloflavum]|uniref:DUF3489 domain-containing protein n=1 Tax=Pararhizobium haloflavum TaxID=2037914 RepID=UPI000C17DA95|nr:DUF3489 domain-containing protein [Pararhizobium haloflavum]